MNLATGGRTDPRVFEQSPVSIVRPYAAAIGLAVVLALLVLVLPSSEGELAQAADAPADGCIVTTTHRVEPSVAVVGSEVSITTGLRITCPQADRRLHVVLLVDASEHMRERGRDWLSVLLSDLETAVEGIPSTRFVNSRVGVVSFSEGIAQTEARLTDDVDELVIGFHNITVRSGDKPLAGLGEGMRKARRLLQNGRVDAEGSPPHEVIVLASRGFEATQCEAVRASTNEVKSAGILLVTACGGGSCERRCLAEAASAPDMAFSSSSGWSYLGLQLDQILGATGPFHPLSEVRIVDELSDRLFYVGGGDPKSGRGNRLEWSFQPWPTEGVTRSYRARVLDSRRFRLSKQAWATLIFNPLIRSNVFSRTVEFDNPFLEVLPPTSTPTPSPTVGGRPSPDATPTGPSTETATATSGVQATPTASETADAGRAVPIYLPLVTDRGCAGGPRPLDLVLAVDVSGSMQGQDVGAMRSRWHAAREVALDLAQYHALPGDRVAVVPFAGDAEVWARLTEDRSTAIAALEALPKWNGSRMDLALSVALREMVGSPVSDYRRSRAIVLLTDGELNQTEIPALLANAADARSASVDVYVVVLGRTPPNPALLQVASGPGLVFSSATTRVLALADCLSPHLHCRR